MFNSRLGKISKADIAGQCPDISTTMIELTLSKLFKSGAIEKVGRGRNTAYIKKQMEKR